MYNRDDVFVDVSGSASAYMMHLFKKLNDNRKDKIKVRIDLKSSLAPTTSTVYLQIWNGRTNSWETLDSNSLSEANSVFSIAGEVTDTEYFDFRQSYAEVAVRVYQLNSGVTEKILSIDRVKISFIAQYKAKYQPIHTNYKSKYNPKKSTYSAKYPHKNPQDN